MLKDHAPAANMILRNLMVSEDQQFLWGDPASLKARFEPSRPMNDENHRGNRAGIRKSGLALLQVNNIKIALTLKRSAAGTG
jgi:hypothetical protein